ncbi:hypothetical protein fep_068 [Pigeonpox virus]|uniref:Uncharacterized protein n=1 Tax=Pigeonpox virus TaxID=10264 RepID=A0A068EE44_9POXV|nr:hypothetical protein HM89_gp070 [Pigeonpox virus]AID46579.1 hypothetical protein fep_068 [Pigeonpox virus]WCL40020.1 hypothetical protein [Pigeonpox virus]
MEKKLLQEYEKLKGQEAKDAFTRQLLICHEDMRGRMDNMSKLIGDVLRELAGGASSSKTPTDDSDNIFGGGPDIESNSNGTGSEYQPPSSGSKPSEPKNPEQPTPEPEKDSSSRPRTTDIFSGLRSKENNF